MGSITNGSLHNVRNHNRILTNSINNEDSTVLSKTVSISTYKTKVIDAYRNRRIFTVFGNYNTLRRGLLKRGWLEKLPSDRFNKLQKLSEDVLLTHARKGNEFEAVIISKIINHFPAFFVWQPKDNRDLYAEVLPYRNRLRIPRHLDFSTKVGLITCAEQQQWYRQDDMFGMIHPRFFRLGASQEERLAFIDEYRITQCFNLLRFLVKYFDEPNKIIDNEKGTIGKTLVHFALARVRQKLDDYDNLDIEKSEIPEEDWENFLKNSSRVINNKNKIKCYYRDLVEFNKTSKSLLRKVEESHPDLKWDGYTNLWILKPGYQNRGRGIVILNNLNEILQWETTHSNLHYIVQKYIERPLLIYGTKFDIRQYMLICVRNATVQIWLYDDCYLRFSSQEYCTDDFDESIHLTNNCVQKKYKNNIKRDVRLPQSNMWSLDQFKIYLKKTQTLTENFWENRVFAGFRTHLIAVVLPSLEETNLCENSFELFGCDFMLDEEYNPILIEINASPDLNPSTEVTARICPMVLEDCLKVIVDLPRNSRASSGLFKMIYEVNYKFKQDLNDKEGLNVCGKSVELCKTSRISEGLKFNKRQKIDKKPKIKRNTKKKVSELSAKTSKTDIINDDSKVLKAAAKEALALRYTMPK